MSAVERAHRELSRVLHPDRYVGTGASERRAALERAVEVNEAWRVVRDPVRRAEALLALAGVGVGEGREPQADPDFLMDMLEKREALSDARQARDLSAVRAMAASVAGRVHEVQRDLSRGFAGGGGPELVGKLGELRFYRRFLDEVSAIEDDLLA